MHNFRSEYCLTSTEKNADEMSARRLLKQKKIPSECKTGKIRVWNNVLNFIQREFRWELRPCKLDNVPWEKSSICDTMRCVRNGGKFSDVCDCNQCIDEFLKLKQKMTLCQSKAALGNRYMPWMMENQGRTRTFLPEDAGNSTRRVHMVLHAPKQLRSIHLHHIGRCRRCARLDLEENCGDTAWVDLPVRPPRWRRELNDYNHRGWRNRPSCRWL